MVVFEVLNFLFLVFFALTAVSLLAAFALFVISRACRPSHK